MKKVFAILLSLLALLCVFGLTACSNGSDNGNNNPEEQEPAQCRHVPGEEQRENEVSATCVQEGGYDFVVRCAICGEEMNRTHVSLGKASHVYGTPTRENEVEGTCVDAGYYDIATRCTVCGELLNSDREYTGRNPDAHAFGDGVITEPNCVVSGYTAYTCTLCNKTVKKEYTSSHTYENGVCVRCGKTQTESTDGVVFELLEDGSGYTVSGYEGTEENVVISDYYNGLSVVAIKYNAFIYNETVATLSIPETVQSIESYAFYNCSSLTSIAIPDSVKLINYRTFYNCTNLKSVDIGNGVQKIEEEAFYNCVSLTDITLGTSLDGIYGYRPFDDCVKLKTINYNGTISEWASKISGLSNLLTEIYSSDDPAVLYINGTAVETVEISGVPTVSQYAFYGLGITGVTLGDGVETVGMGAFYNCKALQNVVLGNDVTTLSNAAFDYCNGVTDLTVGKSLKEIPRGVLYFPNLTKIYYTGTIEEWASIDGLSFLLSWGDKTKTLYIDGNPLTTLDFNAEEIKPYAFYKLQLESVTFGSSVKVIGDNAFYNDDALTEIVIPDGVETLGEYAFGGCSDLETAVVGNGVTEILSAFSGCENLSAVTVGSGVQKFGYSAFYECKELESVNYLGSANDWAGSIEGLRYIMNTGTYPKTLYFNGVAASEIVLSGIESVSPYAFYKTQITSVELGDGVKNVGECSFYYCENLATIKIGKDFESIRVVSYTNSFTGTNIQNVYFNGNASEWAERNFVTVLMQNGNAKNLYMKGVLLDNAVIDGASEIKENAFLSSSVTSVTIANVEKIGKDAFKNCNALLSATVGDGVDEIDTGAFSYCENLAAVSISSGVKNVGYDAFHGSPCVSDGIVQTVDTWVVDHSYNAFIISCVLPDNIVGIADYALSGSSMMTQIIIDHNLKYIGKNAFKRCGSLAVVYYIGSAEEWNEIAIAEGNEDLLNATVYYYSGENPMASGNFWHFNGEGKPELWN